MSGKFFYIFVNCNWVVTRWQWYSTVQYSTVQYTFTHKQYIEQHNNFGRVRAVPRLGELYPGICLTTEEKARKNLSQGKNLNQDVCLIDRFIANNPPNVSYSYYSRKLIIRSVETPSGWATTTVA